MDIIEKHGQTFVKNHIDGEVIFFTIEHTEDVVQRHHQRGRFYEAEEIECMAAHIPEQATILDIGCNVGNHAIWFARFRKAAKIYLFEPNPSVLPVLKWNILMNKIGDVVVEDHLGIGLADRTASGFDLKFSEKNLGAARMVPAGGDFEVRPGDEIVGDEHVDFMKIDVERMELEVLAGLSKTIARCRPNIFVEIDILHTEAFEDWLEDNRYRVVESFQPTKRNTNYMCVAA